MDSIDSQAHPRTPEWYKNVFDHAHVGIFVLEDGVIIDGNKQGASLFGEDVQQIRGNSLSQYAPTHQSDGRLSKEVIDHILAQTTSQSPRQIEFLIKNKKDRLIDVTISCSKSEISSETILLINDVTTFKKYEKKLINERNKALNANSHKSTFLANMSHEIRTPLNSIIGFSDLLLDEDTTEAEKEMYSKLIGTAGKSLLQLIEDIIDVSKIEAGQVKIKKVKVEVNELLDEVYQTFQQEKISYQKEAINLKIFKKMPDKSVVIFTDPFRLRQVLNNLLTNALKFIDEGYIEFGYTTLFGDFIQFYVKDTGIGISKDKKERIFEQFGQDESSYNRNEKGTGLGLAITKSFIELLGGRIWLDTEQDRGSTFYFTLPVVEKLPVISEKSSFASSKNWSNKIILIADDVKDNYLFLKGVLMDTKALILWAKNGLEALTMCKNNNDINIVLMDIRMPLMNGYDATKSIKTIRPKLPIIAQTAFSSLEDREMCLAVGCDDYIVKPIHNDKIISMIAKYMD